MSELNYSDDVFIKEKIDGKIYLMARPSDEHEAVQGNIQYLFTDYFRKNKKFCRVKNEAQLYIDAENYLVPDLMVFCGNTSKHIPLIIIEILSKSTHGRDTGIKMRKYAELGVKEYWIVDCRHGIIIIYLLNDDKAYDKHSEYIYYKPEEFSIIPEVKEEQKAEASIEISPVTMPDLIMQLEDVFTYYDL